MSIKRYTANADTTIANSYLDGGGTAEYSNLGAADSLEVYSIHGRVSQQSAENSRILIGFDYSKISQDRANYLIPASGSVKFFLKMYNVEHPETTPEKYYLSVLPISKSWEEGSGLDLETYTDSGYDPDDNSGFGANWLYARSGSQWNNPGGDFIASLEKTQYFDDGTENLEVDVTDIVEKHINSQTSSYGFCVKLSASYENVAGNSDSVETTYYTKKFSARSSEYFFKRPIIEARWEPQIKDDYPDYKISNSLTAITDSNNYVNVYVYNQYNGIKVPFTTSLTVNNIEVAFYTGSQLTGGGISAVRSPDTYSRTKIDNSTYKFSFVLDRTDSDLTPLANGTVSVITASYKVYNVTGSVTIYSETGSLNIIKETPEQYSIPQSEYTFKILNVKPTYTTKETVNFQVYSRELNWNPNIYTKAVQTLESTRHKNLYYKIVRVADNETIVDYGTGSLKYTQVGYDRSYNIFDVDMSMLEPNYSYEIRLGLDYTYTFKESKDKFKFRVVE
jgi:hypothetical protein